MSRCDDASGCQFWATGYRHKTQRRVTIRISCAGGHSGPERFPIAGRKAPPYPDAILGQLPPSADLKTAFEADGLLDSLMRGLAEQALKAGKAGELHGRRWGGSAAEHADLFRLFRRLTPGERSSKAPIALSWL